MINKTILIVDDDAEFRNNLEDILGDEGYTTLSAGSCSEALSIFETHQLKMVLLDIKLPDGTGINLLEKIKHNYPDCICTIMTAYADLDTSIEALKQGAFHYLQKPVRPMELLTILERISETIQLRKEKINAEDKLRESEEKYRTLFEKTANPIIFMDNHGNYIDGNEAAMRFFECDKNTLLKMNFIDLQPSVKEEMIVRQYQPLFLAGGVIETEYLINEKLKTLELTLSPLKILNRTLVVGVGRDITDQKRIEELGKQLEKQLIQAQKMEAIGTLAGGIAHDFNNILGAVIGYSELALDDIKKEDPVYFNLEQILQGCFRARDLVKQILTFSHQHDQEQKPVRIGPIIKEAVKLLRPSIPTTIEIETHDSTDSDWILADATQIHQVLINLCTNAAHAMNKNGGTLGISLSETVLNYESKASYPDLSPGPYLRLEVNDSGHGMTPEITERIFDPFFTTKQRSEGTGMGLSLVHGIVKNYRGTIRVSSKYGKGTIFQIFLPKIKTGLRQKKENTSPIQKGDECILFVDDEATLVKLGQRMLERLGYEVVAKTSSIEAFETFKEDPDRFDLIITDYTMPNMTGEELAKKIMQIRSDIPVILCTGYSEQISPERAKSLGIADFHLKPLIARDLAESIRGILDS